MTHLPCPVDGCDRARPGHRHICGACEAEIAAALAAVPTLAAELDVTLARQASRIAAGRSTTIPLPYHPGASEASAVLRSALAGWVREIRREGDPWPADTPATMAAWLSERHSRLVSHPAAEEAHGEITSAVRAAERAIDAPAERRFAGRCAQCSAPLYARPGAATVQCHKCDAEPYEVERQLEQMREQIRDQLAHPTRAAGLLAQLGVTAPESTIRRWAKRGRILAHGIDAKGRQLYRIGDIIDIAIGATGKSR